MKRAEAAMHELVMAIHYMSCEGGMGWNQGQDSRTSRQKKRSHDSRRAHRLPLLPNASEIRLNRRCTQLLVAEENRASIAVHSSSACASERWRNGMTQSSS